MKSETRLLAEQIQAINGTTLIMIQVQAQELVDMGIMETRLDALKYILACESLGVS